MVGALASSPALVLVEGEGGIGKSRLVQESLAAVGAGYRRPLVAVCPPFRTAPTLGPVIDAVREAVPGGARIAELGLSPSAGALRPLLPDWAAALPPPPEPPEDARAGRHRLVRAFAELLERLGVDILVVEDLHWADETTLELLLFLVSRQPLPLSLVLTFRPQEVADDSLLLRLSSRMPTGAGTGDGAGRVRISLAGLAAPDAAALVSSMLHGGRVSAALTGFLYECTGGVPLAVEECVRLLMDRADLVRRDGEWTRRALDGIAVPPSIRDSVAERVSRLGADARRMLLAAAVLTGPADERTLSAVSGLADSVVESAVAAALDSGLLVERGSDPRRIAFRHALAAKAVYARVPAAERRAAHRRAAASLEGAEPPSPARLAYHFREAGEIARWREYAGQAADVAVASGDHHAAVALLHDLMTDPQLPAEAVAPLVRKMPPGLALTEYGRRAEVLDTLGAFVASGRLGRRDRAEVRAHLARILVSLGEYPAAVTELRSATRDLAAGSFAGAWAMTVLGTPVTDGAWPAATHLSWLERARRLTAESVFSPAERLSLLINRITALLGLGEESGWTLAEELDGDESTAELVLQRANADLNIGDAAMRWGHYPQTRRRLVRAGELAERHGYQLLREMTAVTLMHLDYFTGGWQGLPEQAEQWSKMAGDPRCRLDAMLVTALLKRATGRDDAEAGELLKTVRREGERRRALDLWLESAAAEARLRLAAGDAGEALAVTREPALLIARKHIWIWATDLAPARVAALTAAGSDAEARELVTAFEHGLGTRHAPAALAGLAECRAALAEARGESAEAARAWDAAARAWARLPRPYDEARAREGIERCTRLVRKARLGGRPGYGNRLSPRELDVVGLLLRGLTNREIAGALSRSPSTVAAQLKSAMRKFGVTSRTALAVSVTQAGILPKDADPPPAPDESVPGP